MTNLGAQVTVPELVEAARAEKADAVLVSQVVTQRDAHLHNTREMSAAFREALPAGRRPLLIVGGPRFDETDGRRAGRGPDLRPGHDAAARWPATWCTRWCDAGQPRQRCASGPEARRRDDGDAPAVCAVRARPLRRATWSTARTRWGCSVTWPPRCASGLDGDEGLFASYSDVQFRAPVRAGDVLEVERDGDPGGHPQPDDRVRVRGWCAGAGRTAASRRPRCSTRRSWR